MPWRVRIRRADGQNCDHFSDAPCTACEADSQQPFTVKAPSVQSFGEHVFEHMYDPWETPVPISSPAVLREECNKRGVQSEYLRDSGIHRSGPHRWV